MQSSPFMMWLPAAEAWDPEGRSGMGVGLRVESGLPRGRGHGLGAWSGLQGCSQDWGWSLGGSRAPKRRNRSRGVGQAGGGGGAGAKGRTRARGGGVTVQRAWPVPWGGAVAQGRGQDLKAGVRDPERTQGS